MIGPMAMPTRTLGRTGLEVSELGYGAWGISQVEWIGADDGESLRALRRSIELGVDFVDTALAYGDGHSEQLVGQVVRESPHVRVASKVPPMNWEWPARAGVPVEDAYPGRLDRRVHRAQPAQPRPRHDRPAPAARLDAAAGPGRATGSRRSSG